MKKTLLLLVIISALHARSQSVFGYWYGTGNVQTKSPASNYLVEMILQPEKGVVTGILNYYFKNTYRSLKVKGRFNPSTRELTINGVPVTFYGSPPGLEIDCIMNLRGKLLVAKKGSTLVGEFVSTPEYQYSCADIKFDLSLNASISQKDSVLESIRNFKETNQVWRPSLADSLVAVQVVQHPIVNYVVQNQFKERQNVVSDELVVNADSIRVDLYDNGEVDGDSVSVFFNDQLLVASQMLSTKAIHFNLVLDPTKEVNELSMFANNLGSIPPNTALMIVNDGRKRYEVRLSSNLQTNATVRIRRNKKPGTSSLK
jgi:hypothetical protein